MTAEWRKSPQDFRDALNIRETVFVKEQGFANEFDETDKTCDHLILYDGEKAVGCARIFPDGEAGWHIGRVAVLPEYRGKGLGARLVCEAEKRVLELGGKMLCLSAQMQAEGFYKKLGYRTVSEPYLDEHCPHVRMEKVL